MKERLHQEDGNVDVFEMQALRGERAWMLGGIVAYPIRGNAGQVPSCRAGGIDAAGEVNMLACVKRRNARACVEGIEGKKAAMRARSRGPCPTVLYISHVIRTADETGQSPARLKARLLGLEQQYRAVAEVEVDEVLRLCREVSYGVRRSGDDVDRPWVTKLPKFLPTMQCQVAPFRSSNCTV